VDIAVVTVQKRARVDYGQTTTTRARGLGINFTADIVVLYDSN